MDELDRASPALGVAAPGMVVFLDARPIRVPPGANRKVVDGIAADLAPPD